MSDPRNLTTWEPLKLIFKELMTDTLFAPADPSKALQRQLLKFLTHEFETEVREHTWTGFEMDCVRWAKLGEVLDRPKVEYEEATEIASNELRGHAVWGEPGTLNAGYWNIQKILRGTDLRRPRRPRGPNRLSR